MGLLKKGFKEGRVYNFSDTIKITQQEGFENCLVKQVKKGYIIIKENKFVPCEYGKEKGEENR